MNYPKSKDPKMVGRYPTNVKSGGGYFYDEVLEYRVWVHPYGEDVYYRAFETYEQALEFSKSTPTAEVPLVLVNQYEYINEPTPGRYIHIKVPRMAEWKVEWLDGSQNSKKSIPIFLQGKHL